MVPLALGWETLVLETACATPSFGLAEKMVNEPFTMREKGCNISSELSNHWCNVMNVAIATATVARPLTFMTARNSDAVETGAGTGAVPTKGTAAGQSDPLSEPLFGRYTKSAYRYDADASRLVILFRNPEDGATLDQIPTEAALRQYREAQKGRKGGKASLELVVGDSDGQDQQNGAGRASLSQGTSAPIPPVVVSTQMTAPAAPSGSRPVNVVI